MRGLSRSMLVVIAMAGLLTGAGCAPIASQYVDLEKGRLLTRAERFYREAERLAAEGQTVRSLLALHQANRADPNHVPTLRRLGAAYEAQGRRRLAVYFYERLLARQPDDREAQMALASVYEALGQATKAQALREAAGVANAGAAVVPEGAPIQALWETFLEENAVSGLALSEDAAYATTQGGSLYCLDRSDGTGRWHVQLAKAIISAPAYSPGPGAPLVIAGSEDGKLWAYSALDGSLAWCFEGEAPMYGTPAVAGDVVYVGSTDGNLYALQRSTGAVLWHFATGGAIHAGPLVAGQTVYAGSIDRNVYAVDATTGVERWRFEAIEAVESTPVVVGRSLYVGANDGRLYCLDSTIGAEVWRYSTGDAVFGRPLPGEGSLYVASASHELCALSSESGEMRWRYEGESPFTLTPGYDGRTLYVVATADPHLYAVDAQTGAELWRHDTGDWPTAEPLVADGALFLGEKDGTVLAYRLP